MSPARPSIPTTMDTNTALEILLNELPDPQLELYIPNSMEANIALDILLNELPDSELELYNQPLSTFEYFSDFPMEIRCMIWKDSLPVGQTVQLSFQKKHLTPDYPGALHATHESRTETLKYVFVGTSEVRKVDGSIETVGKICINPSSDRLLINNLAMMGDKGWKMIDCSKLPWAGKVKTLEIAANHWCPSALLRFLAGWTFEGDEYVSALYNIMQRQENVVVPPLLSEVFPGLQKVRFISAHPEEWHRHSHSWVAHCDCVEWHSQNVDDVQKQLSKVVMPIYAGWAMESKSKVLPVPEVEFVIANPQRPIDARTDTESD
jgi:hypothetical protein